MDTCTSERTLPVFATTQPIFDRQARIYGYEMDFQSGFEAEFAAAAERARAGIDFWRAMGFDVILGLDRGHVTFTRELLIERVPILFPPDTLAVGVPGELRGDGDLIDACRELKDVGYKLELVNFTPDQADSVFLDLADIVRIGVAAMTGAELSAICGRLTGRGLWPLAAGVDTAEKHDQACKAGFCYFLGDFFRRPVLASDRELPSQKAHYLSLLAEVNKPELAYDELEAIIELDVAMTYRLLRFINSAWYGLKVVIESIRHALVLLGPREVQLWASLLVLHELGAEKPRELFRRCLIRAKMAEGIAPLVGMGSRASELFLMGMFSLVEALTDVPVARVLDGLSLGQDVKTALVDDKGPFGLVHAVVKYYESGQWQELLEPATALNLERLALPKAFGAAVQWADNAVKMM
ncbi:MAG: HDOD domain-containing protein [Phycisphaerae bacterium]